VSIPNKNMALFLFVELSLGLAKQPIMACLGNNTLTSRNLSVSHIATKVKFFQFFNIIARFPGF